MNAIRAIKHDGQPAPFVGTGNARATWPALSASYGWRSAYAGYLPGKKTSKIEIVLTQHRNLLIEVEGTVVDLDVPAGGSFTLTGQEAALLRLGEFSDWVAIYVDALVTDSFADWHPNAPTRLRSTFDGRRHLELKQDLQLIAIAHILRRACTGLTSISDIQIDTLAHLLVAGSPAASRRRNPLAKAKLKRIFEFVEARLEAQILLTDLAALVAISPFHFSRLFKLATGLAPCQYVLARRLERAKNLLLTTSLSVREIGWSLGVDNVSHFRRKFIQQFGVRPGELRPQARRAGLPEIPMLGA